MSIGRDPNFEMDDVAGVINPEFALVKTEMDPEIHSLVAKANSFQIQTIVDDAVATNFLGEARNYFDHAEARRVKMKAPALETCREIDSFFKEITKPILEAIDIVKGKKKVWFLKEDQKRQDEEAKARAEAAEAERIQKEKLEAKAKKAEEKGNEAKAESLREQAATTFIAPEIPAAQIKKTTFANGFSSTMVSDIRLEFSGNEETAKKAIAAAVAEGKYPHFFLDVNMAKVKKYFKDCKTGPGPQIGFMIYADATVRSGKR